MVSWFIIIISLVIMQRMVELAISQWNYRYLQSLGGYEVGRDHYPYLVLMHTFFLIYLSMEVYQQGQLYTPPVPLFIIIFLLAQALRIWCLCTLGRFWNTRIIVVPGSYPQTGGPYRYFRHPNYLVVSLEILFLPLAFHAIYTAVLFSILNAVLLSIRIPTEEKALCQATHYAGYQERVGRFFPSWHRPKPDDPE